MTKLIGKIVSVCFELNGWIQLFKNPFRYLIRRKLFQGNRGIMKWFS